MQITLRAARVNNQMALKEAAKRLGVTEQTLSKWENGKTYPTVPNIKKIEEVYNVTYEQLIFLPSKSN